VQTAIAGAYATCKRLGVASGTVTFALDDVPGLSAMGASFIGVGGDTTLMQRAMQGHVAAAREALAKGND
jgi:2-keto-3-deoxy-L-rhamnonate aldolase RhmA